MDNFKVKKRTGVLEALDVGKIREKIEIAKAVAGNFDSSELEIRLASYIKDGMETSQIMTSMVRCSSGLIDIDKPYMEYVTANLNLQNLYHQVYKNTGIPTYDKCSKSASAKSYAHYVKLGIEKELLHSCMFDAYGEEGLLQLGSLIDPLRDNLFKHIGLLTLESRYLIKDSDGLLFELPQWRFLTIGAFIASRSTVKSIPKRWRKELKEGATDLDARVLFAKKIYDSISRFKFLFGTPTLMNAGTLKHQLSSCYVGESPDSIEGIFDAYKIQALLSKFGGGIGWSFRKIRKLASSVRNVSKASGGVGPWVKITNDVANAVDQLGSRKGAIAIYLQDWHGDVMDFLEIRKKGGEERTRSQDIFPAIVWSDLFFDRVEKDGVWSLFDPYDVPELNTVYGEEFNRMYEALELNPEIKKEQIPARDLFRRFLNNLNETPIFSMFETSNNYYNMCPNLGKIESLNLCFSGDTMVAVADGRNAISIKQLAEESEGIVKFPVWCGQPLEQEFAGKRNGGRTHLTSFSPTIRQAVAFKTGTRQLIKVTLSNGDSFRCTPDHELALARGRGEYVKAQNSLGLELEPFFTFTSKFGTPYRHMISRTMNKQHLLMAHVLKGVPEELDGVPVEVDHINSDFKSLQYFDTLDNLQIISKEEHRIKTNQAKEGYGNPIHNLIDEETYFKNKRERFRGVGNTKFCGVSNWDLIELGKEWVKKHSLTDFSWSDYCQMNMHYRNLGTHQLPWTFSKYRFGKDFQPLREYVMGIREYDGEFDKPKEYHEYEDLDGARRGYLNEHFYRVDEESNDVIKLGLTVIGIEEDGIEDVYDLTVEEHHNFYIVTSTDDEKFNNCQGILVHNCTEIAQPTSPRRYMVKVETPTGKLFFEEEALVSIHSETPLAKSKIKAKQLTAMHKLKSPDGPLPINFVSIECVEEGMLSVCNLASINMEKVEIHELEEVTEIAVAALDEIIDLNYYPVRDAMVTNQNSRAIGLGIMGEHAAITLKGIKFGSPEHEAFITEYMDEYSYHTINASSELAESKGSFPGFDGSLWALGENPYIRWCNKNGVEIPQKWFSLGTKVKHQGLRNGYLMAIAPTTSISLIAGTSQAIEPIYKRKWEEDNSMGLTPVLAPNLSPNTYSVYDTAFEVDQFRLVTINAIRQRYVDQAISMNFFIDPSKMYDFEGRKISAQRLKLELIKLAHKLGCKSTYYIRSQSPEVKSGGSPIECMGCQ